jgi:hypothetical protein
MNGERRNNHWFNASVVLALGFVLSALVFGWFFEKSKKGGEVITVTGAARKRIKSDLVVWNAAVSYQGATLADAYRALSENVPRVKQYLITKGIPENEITVSAISPTTMRRTNENGQETSEISGYNLRQELSVRSTDVDKVAQVAREATELINQNILIESNSPQYLYTKIGDLKIEMLGEAAKDAKTRAERIAASTGNSIGTVRTAKMGVMQITAADSTEVSDMGISDTSSIEKDITAVVNIGFAVD